jgi:hypothetical protein
VGSSKKVAESNSKAVKYKELLKTLPENKEYDSLQMITDKIANIDKIFDDAT